MTEPSRPAAGDTPFTPARVIIICEPPPLRPFSSHILHVFARHLIIYTQSVPLNHDWPLGTGSLEAHCSGRFP